jgi:activator of HSP90 ATPase
MATIIQKVIFKKTARESLYDLYMNAGLHSLITDGPVEISEKVGSKFNAFGGYITGKNLQIVKNQLIVQSWRGSDWAEKDTDSVFALAFEQDGQDAILNMVHANVPDDKKADLSKGWHNFYWDPWKQYLAGETITRS